MFLAFAMAPLLNSEAVLTSINVTPLTAIAALNSEIDSTLIFEGAEVPPNSLLKNDILKKFKKEDSRSSTAFY